MSDFRGPRDWVPALTEVAGRHAVIALEIVDPREESLVDVGELTLIDPETGRTLRVDTGDRRLRTAFDEAAAADRTAARPRIPAPRRPPPPTLHRRPVAPRARAGLHPDPRPNRTTRMNFLAPEMLLGLLLVPIAIGFYLWAQRRRSKYAVRFTNLALLSNLAPKRPSWRRHLPPVLYLGAIAALLIGLARPTLIVPVPREDATVILTMDVSGSMRATDVSPTRLDAARASALVVHRPAPRERPRRDRRRSRPSRSRSSARPPIARQLKAAIDGLTARDGTAMGDALMQVLDIAEKIQADDAETPDATASPDSDRRARRLRRPDAADRRAVEPAARRRDPAVRRRQLGRQDRAARGCRPGQDARRADLHDRARDPGRNGHGPRRPRPAPDPRRPAGHRDAPEDRLDHRRDSRSTRRPPRT